MINKNINIKNLLLLGQYLWDLPEDYEHFNMEDYLIISGDNWVQEIPMNSNTDCGTVMCAMGHASLVEGIPKPLSSEEGWDDYCLRIFNITSSSIMWKWLFCSDWEAVDNTSKGAAQRIKYLVNNLSTFDGDVYYGIFDATLTPDQVYGHITY